MGRPREPLHGPYGGLKMGAGSGDVRGCKCETASIVLQEPSQERVAVALAARYRFAVELFGPVRSGPVRSGSVAWLHRR
jgi:hypothetical protein